MKLLKNNIIEKVIILVLLLIILGLILRTTATMDFINDFDWLTIVCSLVSGLFAVMVSTQLYFRHEIRTNKLEILRSFAGNRFDLQGNEFSRTINEIAIVFANSPEVREKLLKFHKKTILREERNNELFELFKAMCDDVKMPLDSKSDRSLFFTPFNVHNV